MLKSVMRIGAAALLAAAIAGAPAHIFAQTTNKPATAKKAAAGKQAPKSKKRSGGGVHGNLAAIDKAAKTVTVGEHSYQITSETRIFDAAGKPATLEAAVVGEYVSLGYKRADDGKLLATKITFGKPQDKGGENKKDETGTEKKKKVK